MLAPLVTSIVSILALCLSMNVFAEELASTNLPPILFLPGYMGCRLYGTVMEGAELPASCAQANLPINQPFELMYNVTLIVHHRECLYSLLTVDFDPATRSYSSPYSGVSVYTQHFGHFESLEAIYWSFPKAVEEWGYKANHNLFAIPYDFRFTSEDALEAVGFLEELQEFVEKVYFLNNQKKVILIGHSNGGPTMYTFLTSARIPQAWKDKYIAAMIGLSGNFLGQMNAIHPYLYGRDAGQQEMICSWEASFGSLPWGHFDTVKNITIVTTYAQIEAKTQRYTSQWEDLVSLFDSVGKQSWSDRLKSLSGINPVDNTPLSKTDMDRTAHPLVDTYCLYGSNVTTDYAYVFNGNILTKQDASEVQAMEGDGNQDILDNQFCQVWSKDTRPVAKRYALEAQTFLNVHHMQMYSNDKVLDKVHDIVNKYTTV